METWLFAVFTSSSYLEELFKHTRGLAPCFVGVYKSIRRGVVRCNSIV